jgi:4-hydroxyphenylpyruvate dioxygenase
VQLAIEFRGMETFCRSLDTALALIKQASEPNVGVNLDVFHYYTGPSKLEDLDLLTPQTLAFVQVCDVSGIPREFASDADRVLPGDGDWRLELLIRKLSEIGYDGWVSLELMNLSLWKTKPAQVASVGFSALRRLLGAASQG